MEMAGIVCHTGVEMLGSHALLKFTPMYHLLASGAQFTKCQATLQSGQRPLDDTTYHLYTAIVVYVVHALSHVHFICRINM